MKRWLHAKRLLQMTRHDYQSYRIENGDIIIEVESDVDPKRYPADIYEPTRKAVYSSQQKCANAWAKGILPVHTDGHIKSSPNFSGSQRMDGSGRLMHYTTISDIRTVHGLTITNAQDYSRGWARESHPRANVCMGEKGASLPLSQMKNLTDTPKLRYIRKSLRLEQTTDDGYDRLVVFTNGNDERVYLASYDGFNDDELDPQRANDLLQYVR